MQKNNNLLKKDLADNFSSTFSKLIDDTITEKRSKGIPFYEKNLIKDIGISSNSFRYYKNGNTGENEDKSNIKVPDLVALYKIKNYFKVPYSYLLGETFTKNIDNLSIGIKFGLDDNSISKLEELKKSNDGMSYMKLILINSIINNDDLLNNLSLMLSAMLEEKCLKSENEILKRDKLEEYIKYSQFKSFEILVKTLEKDIQTSTLPMNKKNSDMFAKLKNQREWISVDLKIHNEKI